MAFIVQLPLSELSSHLIGKNSFSKAIKTKGSSVKEEENKNQGKELESRGSGGRAGIVAPQQPYRCAGQAHLPPGAALRCSWRSTSYLPPLPAPDKHDVRLLAQLGIWTPSPLMAVHSSCLFTQPQATPPLLLSFPDTFICSHHPLFLFLLFCLFITPFSSLCHYLIMSLCSIFDSASL